MRATYYGAQREVDDGLAPLFEYLDSRAGWPTRPWSSLTSDHGEMGGDHWLLEKLGYWDESYHVPLIVVDPRREADGGRGTVVDAVTESVDVLPTICEFIGAEVPLPGRRLVPGSRSCAASRPPSTGGTRPTSSGASPTRSTSWPRRPSGSR